MILNQRLSGVKLILPYIATAMFNRAYAKYAIVSHYVSN
jgi:hypothetical protein